MTYNIKQSSPWLYVLTLLTVIFSGIAFLIFLDKNQILPKGGSWSFILSFTPILGLAFYLPRYTAIANIEIEIDNEGIKRRWLSQFLLHNRQEIAIKWADIKDYAFQPDRQFDQFKLNLTDGTKFKFYHNNDHDDKDDFRKFFSDFIEKVEQLNNADDNKCNDIRLGKTIYETTLGSLVAILAAIMIVGFPIMLFILPHKGTTSTSSYFYLAASYIGAIYFVFQVYIHRKRRKEYENRFK